MEIMVIDIFSRKKQLQHKVFCFLFPHDTKHPAYWIVHLFDKQLLNN